ncbi:MAG: SDR family NAD(P)-dependent oxidoreductase, partial [Pseudoclavibacter sp.]
MARIFITGSTDGLGRLSAEALLDAGHEVMTHARSEERASAVDDLADRGAGVVIGDLADRSEVLRLARDATRVGPFDAIIHNAGVFSGPGLLPVNVVAPYLLTALLPRPTRLVFLSSGMHLDGDASPEHV